MVARADMRDDLNTATSQVREILDSTPANQRDKQIGKQNWGTFETNSQRLAGKSVQESMADIDRFIAAGKTEDGRKIEKADHVGPSTKLGSELQNLLGRNGIKANISSYSVEGGVTSGVKPGSQTVTTEVTETRYEMEGEKKEGLISHQQNKFKNTGSGEADSFFNQYSTQKAAYYKPGAANRNPNGVN